MTILYSTHEAGTAEHYFDKINDYMWPQIALSFTSAIFSPTIAWIALVVVFMLAWSKGSAYRRVVDAYLYPHPNFKALFIAFTKLAPFVTGVIMLAMAAMGIMHISLDNGLVISLTTH